ncbi:unnamed protein product [Dicrocoelium dendriticum]|nr:unnamed protein product [Dicrocoelium dendriticum]
MNTARLLTHSWVRGESTPDVQLALAQKQLENYTQRRREENKRVSEKKSDRPSVPINASSQCSGIPIPIQTDG